MKTYIIASEEYEANMPDLFLMDEKGNYYGAGKHSYPVLKNFPMAPDYWKTATGSDDDRYFHIDVVELDEEKAMEFDRLTRKYEELDAQIPRFEEDYPLSFNFKTKKEYNEALATWQSHHDEWYKENGQKGLEFVAKMNAIWHARTMLFCTFSEKVTSEISNNDHISRR